MCTHTNGPPQVHLGVGRNVDLRKLAADARSETLIDNVEVMQESPNLAKLLG